MTISVVIADDQPIVRDGFRTILQAQDDIEVVAEAADGLEAVSRVREHEPDVVLMDIRMPSMDGIEATRRLAELGSRTRVLILTTFEVDAYVYEALRAGASGFLLKDVTGVELVDAVRRVVDGEVLLAAPVTRLVVERFVETAPRPASSALESLSGREHDVLTRLARGLSNAEIAEELGVGAATVKSHVASVLLKLGLRDRVQAVIFAYEHGIAGR